MLSRLVPFEGYEEEIVLRLSSCFIDGILLLTWCSPCIPGCLQISPFYKNTGHIGLGANDLPLTLWSLWRPYLQIRSHSETLGTSEFNIWILMECSSNHNEGLNKILLESELWDSVSLGAKLGLDVFSQCSAVERKQVKANFYMLAACRQSFCFAFCLDA